MTADAEDWLKFVAAISKDRVEGVCVAIDGVLHDVLDALDDNTTTDLDDVLSWLNKLADEIRRAAAKFGDPNRYSDGRVVTSRQEVEFGIVAEHTWHPNPDAEPPNSSTGSLPLLSPEDPRSPGVFYVETDPRTQTIVTRMVRP